MALGSFESCPEPLPVKYRFILPIRSPVQKRSPKVVHKIVLVRKLPEIVGNTHMLRRFTGAERKLQADTIARKHFFPLKEKASSVKTVNVCFNAIRGFRRNYRRPLQKRGLQRIFRVRIEKPDGPTSRVPQFKLRNCTRVCCGNFIAVKDERGTQGCCRIKEQQTSDG